jgi:hypothetical protein
MPQPSLSPRNAILWLGEDAVPLDFMGKPIFSKWITQYGAETVVEAEELLKTHGIKQIIIPERIWREKTDFVLKHIQKNSLHAKITILWHTSKGRQLFEARQVEGLEDSEVRIHEFVRKLAEINYPLISEDKCSMLDGLAYKIAARLLSLTWDSESRRPSNSIRELAFFRLHDPYQVDGKGLKSLLASLDSFRAKLGRSLPGLLQSPKIRRTFIIQLLRDAENAYWVATKTQLIRSRKCNYGSWGQFSVSIPELRPQVNFSEATALINFSETLGERNSNQFVSDLFNWLSDELLIRVAYDFKAPENDAWDCWAGQFLEGNLIHLIDCVARQPEPSCPTAAALGTLEAWGVFGLQVSLISYVGLYAMIYGMSKTLALGHPVEFELNGRFHKSKDTIFFTPAESLLKLLAANIHKAAGAGGQG